MTTSVTIRNNGPHRICVNEVEAVPMTASVPLESGKTVQRHTLEIGEEVTVNIWGWRHYLTVLEADDTDTTAGDL